MKPEEGKSSSFCLKSGLPLVIEELTLISELLSKLLGGTRIVLTLWKDVATA